MFSIEKRGFGDDSGDSLDDSPGAKAARETTQHLQAWTSMDRQSQEITTLPIDARLKLVSALWDTLSQYADLHQVTFNKPN
jgi:hypothetical protein